MNIENFPIDLSKLKPLALDPGKTALTPDQKATLQSNIQICRDAIVFFTAVAEGKGLTGHTGGAYDCMPEVNIIRGFIDGKSGGAILPIFFDEAGHRVATQYLLSVLEGAMPAEKLLHYREFDQKLPGHPELGLTPGVKFSSGRLGHVWAMCNGVQMGHPDKAVFMFGSDGAQMEGDDAEAARLCVAKELNVKIIVDDNNVTISGHPHAYMPGYDIAKTLSGHGLSVEIVDGEDLDKLYAALAMAFVTKGPYAIVVRRVMAPGIEGLEGQHAGHDAIKVALAIPYLEKRGHTKAVEYLKTVKGEKSPLTYKGSSGVGKNRDDFGKIINSILDGMSPQERLDKVRVFDNDLEGSQGLHHIRKSHAEVYVEGGIMERGNFSAAAGFGFGRKGAQGVYATFSAFLEMVVSEITMARLNSCNVLAHFSHAGVDDMADNTCHFGLNNMFAANGLPDDGHDKTRLYFPCDQHQFKACVKKIFNDEGLRFIFSTRSAVPDILKEDGKPFYGEGYKFETGKDDVIREPGAGGGYVIAFGDTTYRALDAVIRLQEQGVKVGLINKATLNVNDPATFKRLKDAPFVLVVECFNVNTGVGSRFGTELLKNGYRGKYNNIGAHKEGPGGLWQQMGYQGLDPEGIAKAIKALLQYSIGVSEPDVSDLLTVQQAIAIIDAAAVPVPRVIDVRLSDADRWVLAEPIRADRDYPPFDKSQMDGFAMRAADVRNVPAEVRVIGEVAAGRQAARGLAPGEAIAIMTGAPLPDGADAVVPIEHVERRAEMIRVSAAVTPGRFIARRGSDIRAGEVVLDAGIRFGPAQIAVAASVGASGVRCCAKPRAAVLTTGDELVPADREPGAAQIRDSNSVMLGSLLKRMGCDVTDLGIIPDTPQDVRQALERALQFDVAFVSGGMSMGEYDYVPRVLGEMGVDLRITKLRIKPGKPFVFGCRGDRYVFGLPGNPVSGFVCTVRLASRLVARLAGSAAGQRWIEAPLTDSLPANGPREFYQPAILLEDGGVRPLSWKGSADVFTLARANALLVRRENEEPQPAGSRVRVLEI